MVAALGVPGWIGALVVILTVYAILLGIAGALALAVARLIDLMPSYGPQFSELLDHVTAWLEDAGVSEEQIRTAVNDLDLSRFAGVLQQVLAGLSAVLSDLFFIATLIFFVAIDAARFTRQLDAAAEARPAVVAALRSFARDTRRYMIVSTVFGLIVAVVDVGVLYALGIPLPLLWGLLSFVTNYIPNVGFVLGLVPPALLALLEGGVDLMIWVVVIYWVVNQVIQGFIQPKIVGDSVGLSVTLTFVSLVFWAVVLGPLGAILAVPLTLLVKALLIDADPGAQWLRPLLGDNAGAKGGESPAQEHAAPPRNSPAERTDPDPAPA
ncbi:AI-2E family transporter [Phytohabitans flavus]|uniref:AI-2E family transporter n=1 Tax=Phytohabitans flavus TaxID=1076124 RepID=A0A6F8XVQ9_9ACTN|nr:AI-2E family transporter [Phytohabitans flavus]BCB77924.1 hypothetical protein Pflav_043340 [Phytohabitans flavus]